MGGVVVYYHPMIINFTVNKTITQYVGLKIAELGSVMTFNHVDISKILIWTGGDKMIHGGVGRSSDKNSNQSGFTVRSH